MFNWSLIFTVSTYLGGAVIVGAIILRFFKKFPIYIPIIIGLLLLVSIAGTYALNISNLSIEEVMAKFKVTNDELVTLKQGNNILLVGAKVLMIVVYIAGVCEGLSRVIKYTVKKLRKKI